MTTTTVSAKIPSDLKEELDEADVNVSAVVRRALEVEIERRKRDSIRAEADEIAGSIGNDLTRDDVVRAVRETRRER